MHHLGLLLLRLNWRSRRARSNSLLRRRGQLPSLSSYQLRHGRWNFLLRHRDLLPNLWSYQLRLDPSNFLSRHHDLLPVSAPPTGITRATMRLWLAVRVRREVG